MNEIRSLTLTKLFWRSTLIALSPGEPDLRHPARLHLLSSL
jgi:hypothetical protein